MATAAIAAGTDWPVSGHDAGGQRYSPLTQINKSNVANLQIAWTYHLTPAGYTGRPRLVEAVPIVIGNSMYITSSYGEVIALNATTGAELWKYKLPDNDTPAERGVAYWKGAKGFPAAVVFGSRMGRLYQVNAKTGALIDGFGEHGIVNLKTPEVMGNSAELSLWPARGAGDLQEPDHHRRRHAGCRPQCRGEGRYPCLGREDRQAGLDLPHHAAPRRVWL